MAERKNVFTVDPAGPLQGGDKMFVGQERNGVKRTLGADLDDLKAFFGGGVDVVAFNPEDWKQVDAITLTADPNSQVTGNTLIPANPPANVSPQIPYKYCAALVGSPTAGEITFAPDSNNTLFYIWGPANKTAQEILVASLTGGAVAYQYVMCYITNGVMGNDEDGNPIYGNMVSFMTNVTGQTGEQVNSGVSSTALKVGYSADTVTLSYPTSPTTYTQFKTFDVADRTLSIVALNNVSGLNTPLESITVTHTLQGVQYKLPTGLPDFSTFLLVQQPVVIDGVHFYTKDVVQLLDAGEDYIVYRGDEYWATRIPSAFLTKDDVLAQTCRAVFSSGHSVSALTTEIANPKEGQYVLIGPRQVGVNGDDATAVEAFDIYYYSQSRAKWIPHNNYFPAQGFSSESALLARYPRFDGDLAVVSYYDSNAGGVVVKWWIGRNSSWERLGGDVPRTLDDLPEGNVNKYFNQANLEGMLAYEGFRGQEFYDPPALGESTVMPTMQAVRKYVSALVNTLTAIYKLDKSTDTGSLVYKPRTYREANLADVTVKSALMVGTQPATQTWTIEAPGDFVQFSNTRGNAVLTLSLPQTFSEEGILVFANATPYTADYDFVQNAPINKSHVVKLYREGNYLRAVGGGIGSDGVFVSQNPQGPGYYLTEGYSDYAAFQYSGAIVKLHIDGSGWVKVSIVSSLEEKIATVYTMMDVPVDVYGGSGGGLYLRKYENLIIKPASTTNPEHFEVSKFVRELIV